MILISCDFTFFNQLIFIFASRHFLVYYFKDPSFIASVLLQFSLSSEGKSALKHLLIN